MTIWRGIAGAGDGVLGVAQVINGLSLAQRITFVVALFAIMLGALLFYGPIPQDPAYHLQADRRSWLGMPNFGDVVSNIGFAFAGILGLWVIQDLRRRGTPRPHGPLLAFAVYFFSVILVGAGSAWYHLAPDNDSLVWDRLPIAVALTAWFCGVVADRIDERIGIGLLLPLLTIFGVLSVIYWDWTESLGRGDLRLYAMAQFFPMVALPLVCWLFPKATWTGNGYLVWIYVWFAASKAFEHFDKDVFALTGYTVSGHTLKHIALVIAALVVVRMLTRNAILGATRT